MNQLKAFIKKHKLKIILSLGLLLAIGIITVCNLVISFIKDPLDKLGINLPVYAQELVVNHKQEELSMKEWVKQEVENAGLNWSIVDCLIQHESEWDNWRYGINTDGSTDMGLWQLNSVHKVTASVKCRWDYKCATHWAINKRLNVGHWNDWYGYKNNCK